MFIGTVNATLIIWWPGIHDREWTWLGKKEKHAIIHYRTKRKDCRRIMGKLPSYKIILCIILVSIHHFSNGYWSQYRPKEKNGKWTAGKLQARILIYKIIQIPWGSSSACDPHMSRQYITAFIIIIYLLSSLWEANMCSTGFWDSPITTASSGSMSPRWVCSGPLHLLIKEWILRCDGLTV